MKSRNFCWIIVAIFWACGDTSPGPDLAVPTWQEYLAASTVHFEGKTSYVDGDIAISLEELRANYDRLVEAIEQYNQGVSTSISPSIVNTVGNQRDVWPSSNARNLRYCVSDSFGASKARVVNEMAQAAAEWEAVANVDFIYVPASDANCRWWNNVTFAVRPWNQPRACAFFPSGGGCEWRTITMNLATYSSGSITTLGVFRHELGHVLGLRHEHIRVPGTSCTENSNWAVLTSYDSASVMHYPECLGSTHTGDLVITSLDAAGAGMLYPLPVPPPPPPVNESSPIPTTAINGGDQWTVGDFNGDGVTDVYFWWKSSGNNRLFTNNGSGALTEVTNPIPTTGINGGDQWTTGDFNGDGMTDAYFWWKQAGTNRLYLSGANNTFTQIIDPIPVTGINGGDQWTTGDFNGDGATDAYFWWKQPGTNRLYLSGANNTFTQILDPIPALGVNFADEWIVGDFNGDGASDVYFWWKSAGTNRLYLSNSNGTFTAHNDPIAAGAINGGDQWTVGDFNGDGVTDAYFWWRQAGTNRLYLSNGNGAFTEALNPIPVTSINGGDQWMTGDFNGDGTSDVYFWWKANGRNRLYVKNANNTFREVLDPIHPTRISGSDQWTKGDFNGDDVDDVYFWWRNTGLNRLYTGSTNP